MHADEGEIPDLSEDLPGDGPCGWFARENPVVVKDQLAHGVNRLVMAASRRGRGPDVKA
jgi:hypothetical protein